MRRAEPAAFAVRDVAHAEHELDEVTLVLEGGLPRLVRLAVAEHEGTVGAAKDKGCWRGAVGRLDERVAFLAERLGWLGEQQAQKLFRRQRVVGRDFGERFEQHATPAGLVHLAKRRQSLIAELRRDTLAREQREVDRPVADVVVFALDERELVVRQAPKLVFDGTSWLIEQDRGILSGRSAGDSKSPPVSRKGNQSTREHPRILPDERLQRVHRLVERVLQEAILRMVQRRERDLGRLRRLEEAGGAHGFEPHAGMRDRWRAS